ncbi:MAG: transposase, partial [Pseudomonadales bacterium]
MGNYELFPERPVLRFSYSENLCSCGDCLVVQKTRSKKIDTLHIGGFIAKATIKQCIRCKRYYHSEELAKLVPYRGTYGFDIIVYIGLAVFVQYKSNSIIQRELAQQNISISLRNISYLSLRFIVYLSIAHRECQDKIKQHMQTKGGYLLHLDGTCEGSDPHIFSAINAVSDIVLDNQKMSTENAQCISTLLQRLKSAYSDPLAIVSDMKSSISHAVEKIFPGVKHYICHYHFLRDLGKDLFEHEHSTIRRHIKTHRIRPELRKAAKELRD